MKKATIYPASCDNSLKLKDILLVRNNIQMRDLLIKALDDAEKKIIQLEEENKELKKKT